MSSNTTFCIPTIPPRKALLGRMLGSVFDQTVPPDAVAVAMDTDHDGVWVTRPRAIGMARTRWVALGDDDDWLYPFHIERLLACQRDTGADMVFPWFETVPPDRDPLGHFGKPFDPANPHLSTITVLIDRDLAMSIEWGPPAEGEINANDDWRMVQGAVAAGAKIVHLPERTWRWHHHPGSHTSGRPERWG
jgi:hypothetical protein